MILRLRTLETEVYAKHGTEVKERTESETDILTKGQS